MGIRQYDLNLLDETVKLQGWTYKGLKMLQLGDQKIRDTTSDEVISGKSFFEKMGIEVVSIDINGERGSIPIDLSRRVKWPQYKEYFDVVTNFGTSEHVKEHLICFDNMLYFCRLGGVMINIVPKEGAHYRKAHSNAHKYTPDFFIKWAPEHHCEILKTKNVSKEERVSEWVMAVLRRLK
jgi:hypothetical protein